MVVESTNESSEQLPVDQSLKKITVVSESWIKEVSVFRLVNMIFFSKYEKIVCHDARSKFFSLTFFDSNGKHIRII